MSPQGGEQRAQMTFRGLLTSCALFALLILAAPAAAEELGGGAAAPAAAPSATPSAAVAPAPDAEAAQDETPTTPEGEEQPPEEQPDGEQPPTEEDGGPVSPPTGESGGGVGGESTGGLPRTGFEVAALTSIGLGLLLAGAALWPTSSWPPPRDRLSRSTQRR
jgi:hypothetical protein